MPYTKSTAYSNSFRVLETAPNGIFEWRIFHIPNLGESRTGDKLSNWERLIAEGKSATTPLTAWRADSQVVPSDVKLILTTGTWGVKGAFGPLAPPASSSSAVAEANRLALTKFYKKLNKERSSFSGGVFLGEIRETYRMLRNCLTKPVVLFENYEKAVKRIARSRPGSDKKKAQYVIKALSNEWLELAYGWKPFLNDLEDISSAAVRYDRQTLGGVRIHASGKHTLITQQTRYTASTNNIWYDTAVLNTCSAEVVYLASDLYSSRLKDWTRLQALTGFRPEDFVPTVWELIPYSFVIDYFANIGDMISAASTSTRDLAWVQKTTRTLTMSTSVYILNPSKNKANWGGSYKYVTGEFGRAVAWKSEVSRAALPNTSLGIPALTFSLPGRDLQWVNLAMLAVQKSLGDSSRNLTFRR